MKKYLFALIVLSLFIAACGNQPVKNAPGTFSGFMPYEAGSWVEWKHMQGSNTKMEIVGVTDEQIRIQMTYLGDKSSKAITQLWVNANDPTKLSKFIMKTNGEVICMKVDNAPIGAVLDPAKYKDNSKIVGTELFTLDSGKTVTIFNFEGEGLVKESGVSNEVPFGLVKIVDLAGNVRTELVDFGTSGAVSLISDEEVTNCKDIDDLLKENQK